MAALITAGRSLLRQALAANGMSSFSTSRLTSLFLTDNRDVSTIPRCAADLSDEELLAKISAGNREFIAQLFRRHAPSVFAMGRRILRNATEAEDLVQDVFLYVFKKSSVYDSSKGPARSWLFQVAYTQALLRRRKLNSHGFYESSATEEPGRRRAAAESSPAYELTVEGLLGRNAWKAIVEGLTEDQRETLRLHFFEGYTFTEIAEKLGQSFANVRNHHYRGLEKLRKYLAVSELNRR
jgi:RNA polymerase sigma-70 factor (ECF subfamily)